MIQLLFDPNIQFSVKNGALNVAGILNVYHNSDTDSKYPVRTYKDSQGLVQNPKDIILDNNLRIPSWKFRKLLLDKQNLLIGRYDGRLTMPDPKNDRDYASEDPSATELSGAISATFNDYVRNELNFPIDDRFYLIGDVRPWKYADGKYLNVTPELRYSMFVNPNMEILIANGRYDLATSYFGTTYAINHMNLPPILQNRITFTYYNGGHMMYLVPSELKKLKDDVSKMYNRSLGM